LALADRGLLKTGMYESPDVQVAEIVKHVRADPGKLIRGFAGQGFRAVLPAQAGPIHFRAQHEHGVLLIKRFPQLVKSRHG